MNNEMLFPFQTLDAYRVARELARRVHAAKIRDRELRDQATRAAKSCFLCLCEGLPNEGAAMRHKYFVEARNSLAETVGALDLRPSSASFVEKTPTPSNISALACAACSPRCSASPTGLGYRGRRDRGSRFGRSTIE